MRTQALSDEPTSSLGASEGRLYASFGASKHVEWNTASIGQGKDPPGGGGKVSPIKRNNNPATRSITHVIGDGAGGLLIVTEGQGWSQYVDMSGCGAKDKKPSLPFEEGSVPCDLVQGWIGIGGSAQETAHSPVIALVTSVREEAANRRSSRCCCCFPGGEGVGRGKDTVKVWDVMSGTEAVRIPGVASGRGRKLSGNLLACCSKNGVDIYKCDAALVSGGPSMSLSDDNGVISVDAGCSGLGDAAPAAWWVSLSAGGGKHARLWDASGKAKRTFDLSKQWSAYSDSFGFVQGNSAASSAAVGSHGEGDSCLASLGNCVYALPDR